MLLQYIHIILLPHDAIYFVKCTSPSCSKAPPQHDAATPVLHGWDGVWLESPLFRPNITMVIMACHNFCQSRCLSLFGRCSAVDVTGLLAIIFHFPLVLSHLPTHLFSIPFITCCVFNPLFPLMSLSEIVLCQVLFYVV